MEEHQNHLVAWLTCLLALVSLELKNFRIDVDLLGGAGSSCPGLLPLHLLVNWRSAILNGGLPNNDGILMLQLEHKHQSWMTFFLHLYLTDSCQYLMRADRFDKPDIEEQEKLPKLAIKYFENMLGKCAGPVARNREVHFEGER